VEAIPSHPTPHPPPLPAGQRHAVQICSPSNGQRPTQPIPTQSPRMGRRPQKQPSRRGESSLVPVPAHHLGAKSFDEEALGGPDGCHWAATGRPAWDLSTALLPCSICVIMRAPRAAQQPHRAKSALQPGKEPPRLQHLSSRSALI
jgi:hypothetical protein